MDPATLAFAAKVLIRGLEALKQVGWEPTVEDLSQIRRLSRRAVDEWNALVEDDRKRDPSSST
jgi:hypothetical protein